MYYNLAIDTSSEYFSAVLSVSDVIHGYTKSEYPNSHAEEGPKLLSSLLRKHNLRSEDIEVVSIITGPGSITGIRSGISMVNAMKLENHNLKIVEIKLSDIVFCSVKRQVENYDYIISVTNTSSDKVHVEIIDKANDYLAKPKVMKIDELDKYLEDLTNQFADFNAAVKIISGPGANRHLDIVSSLKIKNYMGVVSYKVDARKMIKPTKIKIKNKIFTDISELEPILLAEVIS